MTSVIYDMIAPFTLIIESINSIYSVPFAISTKSFGYLILSATTHNFQRLFPSIYMYFKKQDVGFLEKATILKLTSRC